MLRFLLISTMVLIQTISTLGDDYPTNMSFEQTEDEGKGYLVYSSGEMVDGALSGNHFVTTECSYLDLDGSTKNYNITYHGETGCVKLFTAEAKENCDEPPDKTVKHGETVDVTTDWVSLVYAESC